MINSKTNQRELSYVVTIDNIEEIIGSDNCEAAIIGGWKVMVRKNTFKPKDIAIYFEIDSKVPEKEPFDFLANKHYKIKTQKYTFGGKNPGFWSQGLLMAASDFGWTVDSAQFAGDFSFIVDDKGEKHIPGDESMFLTKQLGVTYYEAEDNKRKAASDPYAPVKAALNRHPNIAKKYGKFIKKHKFAQKIFMLLFGKKKDKIKTSFPTHFQYIKKTDQERCENIPNLLEDKTPYIVTQKCDGSSGTYILERKKFGKYEFYVCSRNVRQLNPKQKSFYDDNYYWECAIKYDIENKLKDYLRKHPDLDYICWQGEVCSPGIQKNPHKLTETHLFCFHMIDSKIGKYDMREAVKIWKEYGMETVPIVDENYILPDDFEEFKQSADGKYDPIVCEGKTSCDREGFVYYKTTNPSYSFKNVSRKYLMKH